MTLAPDLQLPTSSSLLQLLLEVLQCILFTTCGNSDVLLAFLHGQHPITWKRLTLQTLRGTSAQGKLPCAEQVSELCSGADMLQGIGRPGKPWHHMLDIPNRQDMDRAMVQALQAITATALWANRPEYDCSAVGTDEYR